MNFLNMQFIILSFFMVGNHTLVTVTGKKIEVQMVTITIIGERIETTWFSDFFSNWKRSKLLSIKESKIGYSFWS